MTFSNPRSLEHRAGEDAGPRRVGGDTVMIESR
jgi:hypothetical protein